MIGAPSAKDVGPRPKPSSDITPDNLFAVARHLMKLEEMAAIVADVFRVSADEIMQERIKPKPPLSDARQVAVFFAYRLWRSKKVGPGSKGEKGSFEWIADRFGYAGKDGAWRAYTRIEQRARVEPELRDKIETVQLRLFDELRLRVGAKA